MSLYASPDDLRELTGYVHAVKQIRALVFMGIKYRVAPDGRPRVLLSELRGEHGQEKEEPNWAAMPGYVADPERDARFEALWEAKQIPLTIEGQITLLEENCVYFVQFVGQSGNENGLVKIGYTMQFSNRLYQLVRENNVRSEWLRTINSIPGDRALEASIHAKFDHLREHGEWFQPATELLEYASRAHLGH